MSKAVMLSIRPKWVEKIANGEKTIEVRKTRPKLEMPFKCYIYCTRDKHLAFMQNQTGTNLIACMNAETAIPVGGFLGNGKVIGEFTCDQIIDAWWDYVPDAITREVTGGNLEALDGTGMTDEELFSYVGDSMRGHCYGWHISDLRIYDAPKSWGSFGETVWNTRSLAQTVGLAKMFAEMATKRTATRTGGYIFTARPKAGAMWRRADDG